MNFQPTRRSFLAGAGAAAAVSALPSFASSPRLSGLRYGYAAMPWVNEERQSIEDIAAVGFAGVQFRNNAVTDFKPAELKELLAARKLTFVALSSGQISLEKSQDSELRPHLDNAKFAHEAGAKYIQILDELKGHPRTASSDECKRLGKLLTELGKRTADAGVPLGYHNHLNTLSEIPENLDRILEASDPKYVGLELDVAHLKAGGGDPAKYILKYHDRLLFMHLKDLRSIPADTPGAKYPFEFVELGRGMVDFKSVFAALDKIQYKGWAIVELDREPEKNRTPKESAEMSKSFLQQKMGVMV